jgi:hypothetical protein
MDDNTQPPKIDLPKTDPTIKSADTESPIKPADTESPIKTAKTDPPNLNASGKVPPKNTHILANNFNRRSLQQGQIQGTATFGTQRELVLMIRGITRRVIITDKLSVVLGRADANVRYNPDIDLTPYGASERGVSRAHARLHLDGNSLYITDLNSTNGTFIAGKKLNPNEAHIIRQGDELMLGRLPISVQFA